MTEPKQLLTPAETVNPQLQRPNDLNPLAGKREYWLTGGQWLSGVALSVPAFARRAAVGAFHSLHDVFDGVGFLKQLRLINMSAPQGKEAFSTDSRFGLWASAKKWLLQTKTTDEAKLEKSSFRWISLPAIGAAAVAGAGLVSEAMGSAEHGGISYWDYSHLGAAGLALAVASGLLQSGRRMSRKADQMGNAPPNFRRHIANFNSHTDRHGLL